MSSADCRIGREALANFFFSLSTQKAHWYLIILPTDSGSDLDLLHSTFPSLSYLLNLDEVFFRKVLLECSLLKKNSRATGNGLVSPTFQLWDDYIKEDNVEIEWTMCKIGGKARNFVKIGTWSKDHPSLTPQYIWRKSSSIDPEATR